MVPDLQAGALGQLRVGLLAALVLVAGLGGWSARARIEGAVIAPGQIGPGGAPPVVQHPEGGTIEALLVAEGDRLVAGQVLARLDTRALQAELALVEIQYAEVMVRHARLSAERDGAAAPVLPAEFAELAVRLPEARTQAAGQERLFAARRAMQDRQRDLLETRRDQGAARLAGLRAQHAALLDEAALVAAELAVQDSLHARGLAQAGRRDALRREAARLAGAAAGAEAEIAATRAGNAEIALALETLDAEWRLAAEAELRDLGLRLLEIGGRRHELNERIARHTLRAPVAGRVHELRLAGAGAVLRPAEVLARIVPESGPPHVIARIAPGDIGRVRPGLPAMVRFPALAPGDPAPLRGQVAHVSAESLADERSGRRYFEVRIVLSEPAAERIAAAGLPPGTPAEVFVGTGEQTAMDYLAGPLIAHFRRALREG